MSVCMSVCYRSVLFVLLSVLSSGAIVHSSQAAEDHRLHVELNNIQKSSAGCRLSFVMKNALKPDIEDLSLEIVLFDKKARVSRILTLKTGALPQGKTRVKRFDIRGGQCHDISRILINSVETCKGEGLSPDVCLKALAPSTITQTAFGI